MLLPVFAKLVIGRRQEDVAHSRVSVVRSRSRALFNYNSSVLPIYTRARAQYSTRQRREIYEIIRNVFPSDAPRARALGLLVVDRVRFDIHRSTLVFPTS